MFGQHVAQVVADHVLGAVRHPVEHDRQRRTALLREVEQIPRHRIGVAGGRGDEEPEVAAASSCAARSRFASTTESIAPLFADCAGDRDLRAAFMTALFDPPRAAVKETLDRAHARGDLREDVDRDLILDLIGSLVHYRTLFGHAPTTDAEIERAVEALLQGIAGDYPRLLEHSRRVSGDPELFHHLHA